MGRMSLTGHAAMSVYLLLMLGLVNNYRDPVGGKGENSRDSWKGLGRAGSAANTPSTTRFHIWLSL